MKTKFLQRVMWLMIPLLTIFTTNVWGATDEKEYDGADLYGWIGSRSGQYADGSLKMDATGEYAIKTDIWSGTVSSGMTGLTVVINAKINGTGSSSNKFTVYAVNSEGTTVASKYLTGNWGGSYNDHTFTLTGTLTNVTGLKLEYTTKSGGNVGIYSVTATATYTACANSVTISKGTQTNCTFTLGTTGSQPSCSGVSTTVTVSPNTGYGSPSVTQSGASAAPSITGSGTSWTVSYGANTTGTSTINVSCSANNYTITLDKDLTPTTAGTASITATYNSNSNLTSAITKPTATGWTFAGYFTAKNGGGTQIIDASGNVIASVSGYTDASKNWKYAGNITLYAKWTCTVTWSVNGLTNVYSAQTLTYNGTSTKVGSIPGPPSHLSYCGQKFAGWTDAAIVGTQVAAPSTLFTTVAGSPELKTVGNTTFYAVFADYDE